MANRTRSRVSKTTANNSPVKRTSTELAEMPPRKKANTPPIDDARLVHVVPDAPPEGVSGPSNVPFTSTRSAAGAQMRTYDRSESKQATSSRADARPLVMTASKVLSFTCISVEVTSVVPKDRTIERNHFRNGIGSSTCSKSIRD